MESEVGVLALLRRSDLCTNVLCVCGHVFACVCMHTCVHVCACSVVCVCVHVHDNSTNETLIYKDKATQHNRKAKQ